MERCLRTLLSLALVAAPFTAAQARQTDPFKHQKENTGVVAEVVLMDQKDQAICVIDTRGKQDLVPSFAKAAPAGFQSQYKSNVRECAENEVSVVKDIASRSELESKTAMVPLVAMGLAACGVSAAFGVLNGILANAFPVGTDPYESGRGSMQRSATTTSAAYAGVGWYTQFGSASTVGMISSGLIGAGVGFLCGGASYFGTYYSLRGIAQGVEGK